MPKPVILTHADVIRLRELRDNANRRLPDMAPFHQYNAEASGYLDVLIEAADDLFAGETIDRSIAHVAEVHYMPPKDVSEYAAERVKQNDIPPLATAYAAAFNVSIERAVAHYGQVLEPLPCLADPTLGVTVAGRQWLLDQDDHDRPRVGDVWTDGATEKTVVRVIPWAIECHEGPARLLVQTPRELWHSEVQAGKLTRVSGHREPR